VSSRTLRVDIAIATVLAAVGVELASGLGVVALVALVVLGVLALSGATGRIRRRRRHGSRAPRRRP
jgi:hypothetical protein